MMDLDNPARKSSAARAPVRRSHAVVRHVRRHASHLILTSLRTSQLLTASNLVSPSPSPSPSRPVSPLVRRDHLVAPLRRDPGVRGHRTRTVLTSDDLLYSRRPHAPTQACPFRHDFSPSTSPPFSFRLQSRSHHRPVALSRLGPSTARRQGRDEPHKRRRHGRGCRF
jgi:hypothetical protein